MKKLYYHFIYNLESYKIYHIIIVFTIAFIILFFNGFFHINHEVKSIANQNRILVSKEIEYAISSWISERINILENSVKLGNQFNLIENEENFKNFLASLRLNQFDTIQAFIPPLFLYGNDKRVYDYSIDSNNLIKDPYQSEWYLRTKSSMRTTIAIVNKHYQLQEQTMNICTPFLQQEIFKGVICGVLKTGSLFDKINSIYFPEKTYYFIGNKEGTILTQLENDIMKIELEKILQIAISKDKNALQKIVTDDHIVTIKKLKNFDWYIGVGTYQKDIIHESVQKVVSHAIILFLCFILLIVIVNSAHLFLRKRIEQKQKEYEFMLAHKSRISEIGKLVSGINHQLKQPLNSLALIISTTLDSSQRRSLDKSTLETNLSLCQKSITLMDKTIGIFRNFYRANEQVAEFSLQECIQSVLHVNYIELSRHNITVEVQINTKKDILVHSHENYIQQILLVLLQNAKDALISNAKNRQNIYLSVFLENGEVTIIVEDWGSGVSKELEKTLFSEFNISKKYEGSCIGLYFARKLANKKLNGNIELINRHSPTRFRFRFSQHLS